MSDLFPATTKISRFRRAASLTAIDWQEYGQAVLAQVRSVNRSALAKEVAGAASNCASGTWKSDGKSILAHMRTKQRAEFVAAVNADRRRRKPEEIKAAYEKAMQEKRSRAAPQSLAA